MGADSVTPFKTGSDVHVYDLGTGTSFNVSSYEGYENFTIDNFLYKVTNMTIPAKVENNTTNYVGVSRYIYSVFNTILATNAVSIAPTLSYNNTTGVLSVTNTSLSHKVIAGGGVTFGQGQQSYAGVDQTYTCNLTIRMYLVV